MTRDVSAAEAKTHLSELLAEVAHGGERFVIRRRGKAVAALVSVQDLAILDANVESEEDFLDELDKLPEVSAATLENLIQAIYANRDSQVLEAPPSSDGLV